MNAPGTRGPLLAIETATKTARVALLNAEGRVLAEAAHTAERHSGNLLPLCDDLFTKTALRPAQLGAIACGAGPGSFTGLRVGLAVAKGLALPFHTPLVLISSLQTLARDLRGRPEVESGDLLVPCIDAGKGELHAQAFVAAQEPRLEPESDAWRLPPEALCQRVADLAARRVWLGGPALQRFTALVGLSLSQTPRITVELDVPGPSATSLGQLALADLADGRVHDLAAAAPTYGRPADISQPRRKMVGPDPAR